MAITYFKVGDIAYLPLIPTGGNEIYVMQGKIVNTEGSINGDQMLQKVNIQFEGKAAFLNGKMTIEADVEKQGLLRSGIDEALEVVLLAREQLNTPEKEIHLIALCGKSIKIG